MNSFSLLSSLFGSGGGQLLRPSSLASPFNASTVSGFNARAGVTINPLLALTSVFSRGILQNNKVIRFTPTSPGIRHRVAIDRSHLYKGRPVKALTFGKRSSGGRNNTGRITVWHRGGGNKRLYRAVDFKRTVVDVPGKVVRLEYDPNRSADIALIKYPDGHLQYIVAPKGLDVDAEILASRTREIDIRVGNAMPIGFMPIGTIIHNVEMIPMRGAQMARAAGAFCQLLEKNYRPGYALVRNASKELRLVPQTCIATVGEVGNAVHKLEKLGKAGRTRWKGWRPVVRGTAMNPIDHPHGGNNMGRISCTPWGVPTKGKKTRDKHRVNKLILVRAGGEEKTAELLKERENQKKAAMASGSSGSSSKGSSSGKGGAKDGKKQQQKA